MKFEITVESVEEPKKDESYGKSTTLYKQIVTTDANEDGVVARVIKAVKQMA